MDQPVVVPENNHHYHRVASYKEESMVVEGKDASPIELVEQAFVFEADILAGFFV